MKLLFKNFKSKSKKKRKSKNQQQKQSVIHKSHDSLEVTSILTESESLKQEINKFLQDLVGVNEEIEEMASVVASRSSVTNTPRNLEKRTSSIGYLSNPRK